MMMKRTWYGVILMILMLLPAVLLAQDATLTVVPASGERGTGGNLLTVMLENTVAVSKVSFELQYNGAVLSVTGVQTSQRVSGDPGVSFSWGNPTTGTTRVSMALLAGTLIAAGDGPLATVFVQVADDAPLGEYPVTFVGAGVQRAPDMEVVPKALVNGSFSVFIAPHLGLSEESHSFGGVLVGNEATWDLTVSNAGTDRLAIAGITSTRPEFILGLPAFPQVLDPDSGFVVSVTFDPQVMGVVEGLIRVTSNDPDSATFSIPVAGEGLAPDIALATTSHDFGPVALGSTAQWTLTIANEGKWPLVVESATLSGSPLFSLISASFPEIINAGKQMGLTIAFAPSSEGAVSAELTVVSSDPDEQNLKVSLTGRGAKVPDIAVAAQEHNFGKVLVGSTQTWSLTVSNQGTQQLTINRVTFSDNSYRISSPAIPQTVPVSGQINLAVLFAPAREGAIPCQMVIESDDPDEGSVSVSLSGEGTVPNISLSATSNNFGSVIVGATQRWELTVSNTGSGPLTVRSATSSHSDFSVQSPAFPQDVAAGATIRIAVVFAPTGSGPVSGTLTISSNDPDQGSARVNLSGTSLVPEIELSASEYDFGDVVIDSLAVWSVVVTNPGTGALTISEMSIDHPDVVVASPSFPQTVNVGQSLAVRLEYAPSSQDSMLALLTIRCNDPDEKTRTVTLRGNGVPPITLLIAQSVGEPGTANLSIPVELDNVLPIAQMQFSVQYDSTILSVTGVDRTARTTHMGAFSWSQMNAGQILVYVSDFSGQEISAGSGAILSLEVRVADLAPPWAVSLSLTGAVFFDSEGNEYESRVLNGLFTVIVEDINLTETELDFGLVGVGVSSGLQLSIINNGTDELILDSLVSDHPDIRASHPSFPQSVPSSGNIEATIVCRPSAVGPILGHLALYSSDPDEGVTMIAVEAEGVAAAVVEVGNGAGEAGSSDNRVAIFLQNSRDIYGLQFVLNFDGEHLTATAVQPTARTADLDLFNWTVLDPGQVLVVMSGLEGIPLAAGAGEIADVFVSVAADAPGGEQALWLSGLSAFDYNGEEIVTAGVGGSFNIGGADIAVGETEHDFGSVTLSDSALWSVSVRNAGTYPLNLTGITSSHSEFSIAGMTYPRTIPPHDSLMVTVVFSPEDTGAVTGSLSIETNDPDESTLTISLEGTGVAPDLYAPVGQHDYGVVGVGNSLEWLLTISNHGAGLLKIAEITVNGPEFRVTWPTHFPQTIVPAGSMGITVSFAPTKLGAASAILTILSNDPDEPSLSMTLSGEGGALAPDIQLSAEGHDFGDVVVGLSADWAVTITNAGVVDLHVQSLVSSAAEFSVVSPGFPQTIQPHDRISVVILFSPALVGQQNAWLTLACDDPDEASIQMTVNGRGVTAPVPEIGISSAVHHFGSVAVGEPSHWECWISNEGTADLVVQSVTSDEAAFSILSPVFPLTLSPAGEVALAIRFLPLVLGSSEGTVTILSNDPDEESILVHLSGNGIPGTSSPRIETSAGGYNFGAVDIGQQTTWVFAISNIGQSPLVVSSILSDHSDFHAISPALPVTVLPGQDLAVEAVFAPLSEGLKAGALAIQSNDPDHPTVYVFLSGTGQRTVGITLCSLSAADAGGDVLITWTTSDLSGAATFHISRKFEHDICFERLGQDIPVTGQHAYHYRDSSIPQQGLYHYQLACAGQDGQECILGRTTVEVTSMAAEGFILSQNYPNPFNPSTSIAYTVPSGSWVELAIFNVLGQRVRTLLSQYQPGGEYQVVWNGEGDDGRTANSGLYIAQLTVGDGVKNIRMMLLK